MNLTYDMMTPEQKRSYEAQLAAVGLTVADVDPTPISTRNQGHLMRTANGTQFVGFKKMLEVTSIAELKKIAGYPDSNYLSGAWADQSHYPAALPANRANLHLKCNSMADLHAELTDDERMTIRQAARAYVIGNSQKVQHFEPLINAAMFPVALAVSASGPLTISPGDPLVIDTPVIKTLTSITVEPGGQIIVRADCTLNCQAFTKQ